MFMSDIEKLLRKKIKRLNLFVVLLSIILIIQSTSIVIGMVIRRKNLIISADCINRAMCIKTDGVFYECVECEEFQK